MGASELRFCLIGAGHDCPALDTFFLAAPVAQKGRLVQYAGRILRPYDGKATAEVHDYHDEQAGAGAGIDFTQLPPQPGADGQEEDGDG